MQLGKTGSPAQTGQPAQAHPATMESYFFSYTYATHTTINGVPTTKSYIGTGVVPVGTYKPDQTISVVDQGTGLKQVWTYTIDNVNDTIPFEATKANHVTISEYDYQSTGYNLTRITLGTGLGPGGGIAGLGSESGTLIGRGFEGSNLPFANQSSAIQPNHF